MVCRRIQYLSLISKAIEEAQMAKPNNMNARSFNEEECTDPDCNCPKCQLKAHPVQNPLLKAKSSILSCCGSKKKGKSSEDARSVNSNRAGQSMTVCKCASEGDSSLRPATSGALTPTSASGHLATCDNCRCGCADDPCGEHEPEGWFGYIRRPLARAFEYLPFGTLPRPTLAITCATKGGAIAKRFSCAVGRTTKVAAVALWTLFMNMIILGLRVAIFLMDLSMVLLHALTHWYCVARRGWRTRTINTMCGEEDQRRYREYDR